MQTAMTNNNAAWMEMLSAHYQRMRELHPDDRLLILFDIDGTILDMRHMVLGLLQAYDAAHGSDHFAGVVLEDIVTDENHVDELLPLLGAPEAERERVLEWYRGAYWSPGVILNAHRPYAGVMEVMRWFQIQPNTYVGLNTGRSEDIRLPTLECLNTLGAEYKVQFTSGLLRMNPYGWRENVTGAKADAVRWFRGQGFRVFAMVDNEPANLAAVAEADPEREIMLLHADTIFDSQRKALPPHTVAGNVYDLTALAHETALPRHVQFVWHGINDERNLRQFLASNVVWGEVDVRLDPSSEELVLRHDPLEPYAHGAAELLPLAVVLDAVRTARKSIKIDLKETGPALTESIAAVKAAGFDDSETWFNADYRLLGREGFAALKQAFPGAIIQCPIDSIAPLILSDNAGGMAKLAELQGWGVNRFSVKWDKPNIPQLIDALDAHGYELNIYNVPDLRAFLEAALLLPRSITSDFNFPRWSYFGRGSGAGGRRHEYFIKEEFPELLDQPAAV